MASRNCAYGRGNVNFQAKFTTPGHVWPGSLRDGVLRAYYVWPDFPSISITGEACALDCAHCGGHYLKLMEPATEPEALVKLCEEKKKAGAKGVLLSGGCDARGGILNLKEFLPAIRKVHEMGLMIKLHTGLVDSDLAGQIAASGADIASQEMVGDPKTIKKVFGIDAKPRNFLSTFENLRDAGIPHIAPHIVIGLDEGKVVGEFMALEMLAGSISPSTIAFVVLRPTKGTPMEGVRPPGGDDVRSVVSKARLLFPDTKLVLLALRPRGPEAGEPDGRFEIELGALDGGIDGIEHPSSAILAEAEERGLAVRKIGAYGVLPVEYESRLFSE